MEIFGESWNHFYPTRQHLALKGIIKYDIHYEDSGHHLKTDSENEIACNSFGWWGFVFADGTASKSGSSLRLLFH